MAGREFDNSIPGRSPEVDDYLRNLVRNNVCTGANHGTVPPKNTVPSAIRNNTKWWEYSAAIISFSAAIILVSFMPRLIDYFASLHWFRAQRIMQFPAAIIDALIILSASVALNSTTNKIHPKFCAVLCLLGAIYLAVIVLGDYNAYYSMYLELAVNEALSVVFCLNASIWFIVKAVINGKHRANNK